MRVALFITCLADALFPDVGKSTVEVLRRLGHDVVFPEDQTCCGQMHINTGYQRDALHLVRHHAAVFGGYDAVVAPSASCVASVRHQHAYVARRHGEPGLAEVIERIAARTYDLSQFLVHVLGVTDVGAHYPRRVAYHPTCHSLRLLRASDWTLQLLRAVDGLELVDLSNSDQCCGFGGTFALKNASISAAMLEDKMEAILASGAELVAASDASCLMHIGGGLSRRRVHTRTVHLAQILASTS